MSEQVPPRLLLVEDDPDTASLVCEALTDHFGAGCVRHAATVRQALAQEPSELDLVLSDMNLPDGSGLDVLDDMLRRRSDLPVVLITGEGIIENALKAIQRGAYDYVVKAGDYLFAVPLVVQKNLALWRTKQENKRLHEELERSLEEIRVKNRQLEAAVSQLEAMATTDPLTGLTNRRAFTLALERCFSEKQRYGQDLGCLMIDLDNFKSLNDTLGHPAGDRLLQQTAKVLEANCRKSDVAGRYGGDEFIVLLPMTDRESAHRVGERILKEFEHLTAAMNAALPGTRALPGVSMSLGLALFSQGKPSTPEQLVSQADHALYQAKQSGKSRLAVYDPGTAALAPKPQPQGTPISRRR